METTTKTLFSPITVGEVSLKNRVVMAPMTRSRGIHATHMPTNIMQDYYEQRASAGLIITEGIIINEHANGYINIPGIYNDTQVGAWKKITDKVHAKGGKIFAQLWHVGRVSHPDLIGGNLPEAPSAINPNFYAFTFEGKKDTVTPKALTIDEIKQTIADFRQAALNAIEAGFDGVELHGANAYLIHQFIDSTSNQRTDEYGGSVENRAKFVLELLAEVANAVGSSKVGIRLSPVYTEYAGLKFNAETEKTFDYIIEKLNDLDLAYLHLTGALSAPSEGQAPYEPIVKTTKKHREIYNGKIIINKSFDQESAEQVIEDGVADMVSFGALFIANPDLVERFKTGAEFNQPIVETFYQGGESGYTDYPSLAD